MTTNAIPHYDIGDQPTLTALFVNATNTPTNPTTVTFITKDPAGTEVSTVFPNAAITNPSTGTFVYTYPSALSLAGTHAWRVKSVGVVINAEEGTLIVDASLMTAP